jgi:hypothetical protein
VRQTTLLLLLGLLATLAGAQPPTARPRALPPVGVADPPAVSPRLGDAPLTAEQARAIQRRLEAHRVEATASATRLESLRQAGVSESNDAIEKRAAAGAETAPLHVGLLRPPASSRPKWEVDPGLESATRAALLSRLGRDPSPAEVAAEIQAFDARIARANGQLAAKRQEIAATLRREGVFPRALEESVLGLPRREPSADPSASREGFHVLIQTLLAGSEAPDSLRPRLPVRSVPVPPPSPPDGGP